MIGLLYKDLLSMKKSMLRILVILGIYIAIFAFSANSSSFISVMIVILSSMLVLNAFAYDEVSKWDYYALSLPITKDQLVLSRYVLALLLNFAGILIAFAVSLIRGRINTEEFMILYAVASIALILAAVLLPLLFHFGTQKARMWIFLLCMLPTVLLVVGSRIGISLSSVSVNPAAAEKYLWLLLPVAIVMLAASYLISCNILSKKEF